MTDEKPTRKSAASPAMGMPVPRENWDEPKSGVHDVGIGTPETQLDTIVRISRDVRSTGHSTVEALAKHDGAIAELTGRMTSVEGLALSIKGENQIQTSKLAEVGKAQDIQTVKLDTMLKILTPASPERVREMVATELRISDRTAEQNAEHAKDEHKRKFQLTALQGIISVATALVTAGVVGALIHAHC